MSDLSDYPSIAAEKLGLVIVLPGPRDLLLDIDDKASRKHVGAMLTLFRLNGDVFREARRTVSNGGNAHIYLTIPDGWADLTPVVRVALQACFGSDRTREALSMLRILQNYDIPPTVLFERPDEDVLGVIRTGGA